VTHHAVRSTQTVTITATFGGVSQTAQVTVDPAVLLTFSISPASVKGASSTSVTGTLTLSGPAPSGGAVISLVSSETNAVTVPTTVTVPSGQTTAKFKVGHKKVTSSQQVGLTATLSGVTKSATVTVSP